MTDFQTLRLPAAPDVTAPDGADVRILLALDGGSMAHFELAPGETTLAIRHRTVEEIWYILAGSGEMWRKQGSQESIETLTPGVCLTIPVGTHFQFRAHGADPLATVAITMPPWPGEEEAITVDGPWTPTK